MSHLLHAMRRRQLEALQAAALAEALGSLGDGARLVAPRSASADPARLRGLPMIGAAGGHIPGTRPGSAGHLDRIDRTRGD